jgi:ADP-heptose:LPS heptosyltransferase
MLCESWQTVRHVLLCFFDPVEGMDCCHSSLSILRQVLPEAQMTLLTADFKRRFLQISGTAFNWEEPINQTPKVIARLRQHAFDAAIFFTQPSQSPHSLAYLCYLAGIPIRLGQSKEFSGGVLSHVVIPPADPGSLEEYHLHLLRSSGFPVDLERSGVATIATKQIEQVSH